jgi:multiple sugar transport system ATP-binding protein
MFLLMATVSFKGATRVYPGSTKPAVDSFDLEIADGEFLVLVGPSGCGKSTSLRMLAGLEEVNQGSIMIGDRDVTNLAPKDRDIAMVFQSYALYPHMTVRQNMGFALQIAGMDKKEIEQRVSEAARILDLEPYLDRKPKALSGGQRQRVAMGRAIVRKPQVFLMDEPLSNLDAKLRVQTRTQIAKLQRDLGVTTVYVTHDQTEAMTMGDRIAVLKDGILMQVGTPQQLYDTPQNSFVAGFIGSPAMNLFQTPVADGHVLLGGRRIPLPPTVAGELARRGGDQIVLGMRPEDLRLTDDEDSWPVEVLIVEGLGADAYVYGELTLPDKTVEVVIRTDGRQHPTRGSTLNVKAIPHHVHYFDTVTGTRINE